MKFTYSISTLMIMLLTITAAAQKNDIPKNIAESVGGTLGWAQGQFLAVAEAMPEEKYAFIPTAGNFEEVRSFAEQVKHVACGNYAFSMKSKARLHPMIAKKVAHLPPKPKQNL